MAVLAVEALEIPLVTEELEHLVRVIMVVTPLLIRALGPMPVVEVVLAL
jgi:hypothetical protein